MIETPYRNTALRDALLAQLQPTTALSISVGLTLADGFTRSESVAAWRLRPNRCRPTFPPSSRFSHGGKAPPKRRPQDDAGSATLEPNSAATFFFGLMFAETTPRPTGAARFSHAGSAATALGS